LEVEMRSGEAFKSNYLKGDDIKGHRVAVVIEAVTMETLGQGADQTEKPLIMFRGKEKGLICNRTNWDRIADLLGSDDSDDWSGKAIVLGTERVRFQGKVSDAIRVIGVPKSAPSPRVPEPEPEPAVEETWQADDSDVPFAILLPALLTAGLFVCQNLLT
jgi:hypothetical protein